MTSVKNGILVAPKCPTHVIKSQPHLSYDALNGKRVRMKPGARELSNNFRLRQTFQHRSLLENSSAFPWHSGPKFPMFLKLQIFFPFPDFSSPCHMTIEGSCCKRVHVKNYRKSKLNKHPQLSGKKKKKKTPPQGFGRYLACHSKKVSFWEIVAHQNPPLLLRCKAGKAGRVTNRPGLL